MAETEAAELETRIADLQRERADLTERSPGCATASPHRPRSAAAAERGLEQLDRDFAELFTRLFGGGQLRLVDADDPLAAGLDIMASLLLGMPARRTCWFISD